MDAEFVLKIGQSAVNEILWLSGPLLLVALGVGLIISVFQATTQIQEQTLTFVPKIICILLALVWFGPWMLTRIVSYTTYLFENLGKFVG